MGNVILVTGGAGYVGSHLTRRLLERGARVRVLDRFLYGRHGLREVEGHPNLELVTGDICDPRALAGALRDVSAVVALAALVGDAACDFRPDLSMAINFDSTRATVEACRKAGVQRLVFASSCSVYGANGDQDLDEESQLNPVSLYARTRILSEEVLLEEGRDLDVFVLRLATVCGVSPRMRFDLMVNTMTASAIVHGAVRVTGADQWRPHLHVRDAAEAFLASVEAPRSAAGIYNVGSDEQNFTVGEIAEQVAAHVPGTKVVREGSAGDPRSYRVCFGRIRSALGFRPARTVDDAIREVAALLRTGTVRDFTDERFHNARWIRANWPSRGAA